MATRPDLAVHEGRDSYWSLGGPERGVSYHVTDVKRRLVQRYLVDDERLAGVRALVTARVTRHPQTTLTVIVTPAIMTGGMDALRRGHRGRRVVVSALAGGLLALALTLAAVTLAGSGSVWIQRAAPVFVSNPDSWEHAAAGEPTVLYDHGLFRMWYTAGYSDHDGLGYATSRDGLHWTRYAGNPVLGQGGSGFAGNVTHTSVLEWRGRYYAYFNQDATSLGHIDPNLYRATSPDGVHWTVGPRPVLEPGDWDNSLANSYVWVDAHGTWRMLYEAMDNTAGKYGRYLIGLASSPDGVTWTKDPASPLLSLRLGTGMTGGPWLVTGRGGYALYYHASTGTDSIGGDPNLPTDIYVAHSTDLVHWTPSPTPIVPRLYPDWEGYQTSDPTVVVARGRTMIYFAAWGPHGGGVGLATLP